MARILESLGAQNGAQTHTGQETYKGLWRYEDGAVERAQLYKWTALGFLGSTLLFLGLFLHQVYTTEQFQPMIQVARVDVAGTIELVGLPQDLLAWKPTDAVYADMLRDWVRQRYWRHIDKDLATIEQHWVTMHTCGPALKQLELDNRRDDPHVLGKRKVQIAVGRTRQMAVSKDRTSQQWHVEWEEIETIGTMPAKKQSYSAMFTVSRVKPTTAEWFAQNRTGTCVIAYSGKEAI